MDVRFQNLAGREYLFAYRYYFRVDPQLAERFRAAVDVVVSRISASPDSLPQIGNGFRRIRVKRFPYAIFFKTLGEEAVGIYAVAHTSRRPGYWRKRKIDGE